MTENNSDFTIYLLGGIAAIFLFILIVFGLVNVFIEFSSELKHINCEIRRTEGHERKHWIRKRRRLWLSLLPFVKY